MAMIKLSEIDKAMYWSVEDEQQKEIELPFKKRFLIGVIVGLVLLFAVIGFYYTVWFYFKYDFGRVLEWIY